MSIERDSLGFYLVILLLYLWYDFLYNYINIRGSITLIRTLQSFRFIAIFFVFLSHLSFLKGSQYEHVFNRYFSGGYWGVTFFLVLSGFVISYNYYDRFENIDIIKIKNFLTKRIKKLYPIHFITFTLAIPFAVKSTIDSPVEGIATGLLNASLLHSYIPNQNVYFSFNWASWYVSACLLFYVLTPFLIKYIKRINKSKFHLVGMGILVYFFLAISVYVGKDLPNSHWLFYISPFFRTFDYAIGIMIGIYMKTYTSKARSRLHYNSLEFVSILMFCIAYFFHPYIHRTFTYGVYYLPFVVFIVSIFSLQKGWLSKVLSNQFLVYLGGLSFEFYMIHQLVIRYIVYVSGNWNPLITSVVALILSFIGAVLLKKVVAGFNNQMKVRKNKKIGVI